MTVQSDVKKIVVYEIEGNWAGLLRRRLANEGIPVERVETLAAFELGLTQVPSGCFGVQVTGEAVQDGLHWLYDASRRFPTACFVAIVKPNHPKWGFYEAGASLVIDHPFEIPTVARLVRRFLARRAGSVRPTQNNSTDDLLKSMRSSLPWSSHATEGWTEA